MEIQENSTEARRKVAYFGEVFYIANGVRWMATDIDGAIYAFSGDCPLIGWETWQSSSGEQFYEVGRASLGDKCWKDTLMEVV